ncbi:hypothetical protein [Micromonospora chokoriensis]
MTIIGSVTDASPPLFPPVIGLVACEADHERRSALNEPSVIIPPCGLFLPKTGQGGRVAVVTSTDLIIAT